MEETSLRRRNKDRRKVEINKCKRKRKSNNGGRRRNARGRREK